MMECLANKVDTTGTTAAASSFLVLGQHNTGKSSFCRYLINTLLSIFDRVVLLDADLSDPILSPPHTVSLHIISKALLGDHHYLLAHSSSNITELLSVVPGGVSPDINPNLYLSAVGQCWMRYQQLVSGAIQLASSHAETGTSSRVSFFPHTRWSRMVTDNLTAICARYSLSLSSFDGDVCKLPLIVNSHGWVSGLGWQLLDAVGALTWSKFGAASTGTAPSTTLAISCPFEHVVEQFYGQLPLPWSTNAAAIEKVTALCTEDEPGLSRDKCWLRFMSYFNPAYKHAVHFPGATEEEFFHESTISPHITQPELSCPPKLVAMQLRSPNGQLRFAFSSYQVHSGAGVLGSGNTQMTLNTEIEQIPFALTGALVALCTGNLSSQEMQRNKMWTEPLSWRLVCYCWVHSVDLKKNEVYAYIPSRVEPELLEAANIFVLGHHVEFSPSLSDPAISSAFPHEAAFYHALLSTRTFPACEKEARKKMRRMKNHKHVPMMFGGSLARILSPSVVACLNRDGCDTRNLGVVRNGPYRQEFVFELMKTGKIRTRRGNIPRRCHKQLF